jgi:hypothetical protein
MPALIARPRAFGESTIRADMPSGLVTAIDRCDKAQRRQVLRAIDAASDAAGFDAACEAAERVFESGRVPDAASVDLLARRIGSDERGGSADLSVYDRICGAGGAA